VSHIFIAQRLSGLTSDSQTQQDPGSSRPEASVAGASAFYGRPPGGESPALQSPRPARVQPRGSHRHSERALLPASTQLEGQTVLTPWPISPAASCTSSSATPCTRHRWSRPRDFHVLRADLRRRPSDQEVRDHQGDTINASGPTPSSSGSVARFAASLVLFTLAQIVLLLHPSRDSPARPLCARRLFPLQLHWSLQTLREGLTYASVCRLQTRYRVLYAVVAWRCWQGYGSRRLRHVDSLELIEIELRLR